MNNPWYEQFFNGVVVKLWQAAVSVEQTRMEVDFLEEHLRLGSTARVLDFPCGHGRHAVELATRGHRVTGVDFSQEMLAEAGAAAVQAAVDVDWQRGDMASFQPAEATFDGAFCLGNSFGYLDRTNTRGFIERVANALKPTGRFAFDYGLAAESILPRFSQHQWATVDSMYFLEENSYDVTESCIETRYTIISDGVAETKVGLQWVYTVAEIRDLLRSAGMSVVGQFGGVAGETYQLSSPVLVIVAEKAA